MHNQKLSIITVAKNACDTIESTIQSVVNQTYKNIEFIIIDGASTDCTSEIINRYRNRISKYICEPDNGIYDAMNKGIDCSTGEWLYFLGADDIIISIDTINRLFSSPLIINNDIIYGNVAFKHSGRIYDGHFDNEKLLKQNICHQAIFTRRKLFERMGKFNTNYRVWADWDFNIRCKSKPDIRWSYVDLVIAEFNENGFSSLQPDYIFLKEHNEVLYNTYISILNQYNNTVEQHNSLLNSRDYRTGKFLLVPLRIIRKIFFRVIHSMKIDMRSH